MELVGLDGTSYYVRCCWSNGFSIDPSGTVTHFEEDAEGNRAEWEEHISDSPAQDVFGGEIWDLVLDPRAS